ncbi:cell division protein [Klebsiella michiganensis]|nr:cell division protein [Klebsiella michiganensis]
MAYTIPVIIIGGCWFAWRHQENDEYIDYFAVSLRLIGALALILTSCGLAAINADDIWYFASGGVIGQPVEHYPATAAAQQRRHNRAALHLGGRTDAIYRLVLG